MSFIQGLRRKRLCPRLRFARNGAHHSPHPRKPCKNVIPTVVKRARAVLSVRVDRRDLIVYSAKPFRLGTDHDDCLNLLQPSAWHSQLEGIPSPRAQLGKQSTYAIQSQESTLKSGPDHAQSRCKPAFPMSNLGAIPAILTCRSPFACPKHLRPIPLTRQSYRGLRRNVVRFQLFYCLIR
jgi:hypothetical protein